MGKETQIEQAIEAVGRQPGSPAYAFLAEHYLEQGQDEDALRVCQAGFAANPGFERGAVAYLSVLRRRRDTATASEVYGRAVAYLARSARIRMAWALILADAGKEREARNLAREALDLDPLNREARAFVATLGGTPAPQLIRSDTGERGDSTAGRLAALSKDAIFDDSDLDEEGVPRGPGGPGLARADVRPWIRPIGQRTTPHSMFDLTPAPAMTPQDRRALRDGDVAITKVPEEAPTEMEVPVDLFEEPTPGRPLKPRPTPARPPRLTPAEGRPAVPMQARTTPPPTPPLPRRPRRRGDDATERAAAAGHPAEQLRAPGGTGAAADAAGPTPAQGDAGGPGAAEARATVPPLQPRAAHAAAALAPPRRLAARAVPRRRRQRDARGHPAAARGPWAGVRPWRGA